MNKYFWMGVAVLLWAARSWAGEVAVDSAWVRATAPGQDSAAVSLRITSRKEARLVAVSSPAASHAGIHVMKHEDGMMKMREIDALPLPVQQEVMLGHGDHLMLVGLKRQLKLGERVPLKLTVEFADKGKEIVEVEAEVRPLAAAHDMPDEMGGMHHHGH